MMMSLARSSRTVHASLNTPTLRHLDARGRGARMGDHSLHPHSVGGALAGGLLMGAIHVITGADHLSAVASLACGNTRTRAFWLGVRWGAGHSVGLLCVFLVVMALRVDADEGFMDSMEWWMGIAVGTLMFSLGLYGVAVADERSHAFDPHDATRSPFRGGRRYTLPLLDKTEPEPSYGVADPEKVALGNPLGTPTTFLRRHARRRRRSRRA